MTEKVLGKFIFLKSDNLTSKQTKQKQQKIIKNLSTISSRINQMVTFIYLMIFSDRFFKKIYSFKEKSNKQFQNWQLLRKILSNLRQKNTKNNLQDTFQTGIRKIRTKLDSTAIKSLKSFFTIRFTS